MPDVTASQLFDSARDAERDANMEQAIFLYVQLIKKFPDSSEAAAAQRNLNRYAQAYPKLSTLIPIAETQDIEGDTGAVRIDPSVLEEKKYISPFGVAIVMIVGLVLGGILASPSNEGSYRENRTGWPKQSYSGAKNCEAIGGGVEAVAKCNYANCFAGCLDERSQKFNSRCVDDCSNLFSKALP